MPILDWHSLIEAEAEIEPRYVSDVADRLVALCLVAAKAEGLLQGRPADEVGEVMGAAIKEEGAEFLFTPAERAFIDALEPDQHEQVQFYWRYEAAWVLLWALRWVDGPLSMPCRPQDPELVTDMVRDEPDLGERGLRPIAELLDEADLIYRYHWACVTARQWGNEPPAGLSEDVVMERHHALNWLIRYEDEEWDRVGTDT